MDLYNPDCFDPASGILCQSACLEQIAAWHSLTASMFNLMTGNGSTFCSSISIEDLEEIMDSKNCDSHILIVNNSKTGDIELAADCKDTVYSYPLFKSLLNKLPQAIHFYSVLKDFHDVNAAEKIIIKLTFTSATDEYYNFSERNP